MSAPARQGRVTVVAVDAASTPATNEISPAPPSAERPIPSARVFPPADEFVGMSPPALARSFAHCAAVTRTRARNFYFGLRLLPHLQRRSLYAIYAWMRAADDAADEPLPAPQRRRLLEECRRQTRELVATGRPPAPPQGEPLAAHWPAMADTLARFPVRGSWLLAMLDGLEQDIEPPPAMDQPAVDEYCDRVGGTVGLCCLAVWGLAPGARVEPPADLSSLSFPPAPAAGRAPPAPDPWRLALLRGRAFQRTNILRDLAEDLDASPPRLYIAADRLRAQGLSPADLRAWSAPIACAAVLHELAGEARADYDRSAPLDGLVAPACRPALVAMTRIYRALLERIARRPAEVMRARVRVPTRTKLIIAAGAALSGLRANLRARRAGTQGRSA